MMMPMHHNGKISPMCVGNINLQQCWHLRVFFQLWGTSICSWVGLKCIVMLFDYGFSDEEIIRVGCIANEKYLHRPKKVLSVNLWF